MPGWAGGLQIETDETGCRAVPGQPAEAAATLALYGCSCVFGLWLPAEDTACALLQTRLGPRGWRVENHGVNGYGQGQNLLELQRDLRFHRLAAVGFCWIEQHLVRNVADIGQVQRQTVAGSALDAQGIRTMPRALLAEDGDGIVFRQVAYARPDIAGLDLAEFAPDPCYLDLVCAALLRRAATLVHGQGGHFFVLVQMGHPSAFLRRLLAEAAIPVVDAAVRGPEWTIGAGNPHPNAAANRRYADAVEAHLAEAGLLAAAAPA